MSCLLTKLSDSVICDNGIPAKLLCYVVTIVATALLSLFTYHSLSSGVQTRLKVTIKLIIAPIAFANSNICSSFQTKIVPKLIAYFDNVLSVRPLKGPILVDRYKPAYY